MLIVKCWTKTALGRKHTNQNIGSTIIQICFNIKCILADLTREWYGLSC